jgi:predicted kinase
VDVAVEPERARAERDVVEDRLRERVGPLEDEADARAHRYRVDIPPVEIDAR